MRGGTDLSVLLQHTRGDIIRLHSTYSATMVPKPTSPYAYLLNELDDGVLQQRRARLAELLERHEARVGAPQHAVAVAVPSFISLAVACGVCPSRPAAHPGTTWPLFSVRQRNSLMSSCETLLPISFCMLSCQRSTSWFAKLWDSGEYTGVGNRVYAAPTHAAGQQGRRVQRSRRGRDQKGWTRPSLSTSNC